MDPLTYNRYSRTMQDLVENKLLNFTDEETQLLKELYDFIGLQYYTLYYVKPNASINQNRIKYKTDNNIIEIHKFYKNIM